MSQPHIPKKPTGSSLTQTFPDEFNQVGLNATAFDRLIKSHGVRMIHARPIPCPNQRDIYASDHPPTCPICVNGYVYYNQKEFLGAFIGNTLNRNFMMNGTWDIDQATLVLPAKYDDGSELDVQIFDHILIPDFTVRYYQRVQHSQVGVDRLHFPAISIDKILGADGKEYVPGKDVIVNEQGYLKWIGKRPGYDLTIDQGGVYSVNYYCRPSFTVIGLPHQLRMTQTVKNGHAVQERFPQVAIVRKDFIPYQQGDKTGKPDAPEPRDGQV